MMHLRAFQLSAIAFAGAIGCSQPQAPQAAGSAVERAVARAYGSEFVDPESGAAIVLIGAKPWSPGGSIVVSGDGQEWTAPVHHLRIAPRSRPSWTNSPVEWSVGEPVDGELPPGASAVAFVPPLPSGTTEVSLDGNEVRFEAPADNWPAAEQKGPSLPPAPELVEGELGDPTRAWRVDLARALAGKKREAADDSGIGLLRAQHSARWRTALARLTGADSALASRLASSMARVVEVDGRAVPAWSTDLRRVDALLHALLTPEASAADLKLAADAWLADEPVAVAWVIDDGGADRPALIGMANLTDAPAAASISAHGAVELAVVEPRQAIQVAIAQPSGAPSVRAEVRVGNAIFPLDLVTAPIPCSPPGVRMGPLLPEWTMPEWLGERAGSIDVGWATAALLQPMARGAGAWEVFLDCRADKSGEDTVRLLIGAPSKPSGEVRVSRSGAIEGSGALAGVKGVVREEGDRWTATLEIPAAAMAESVVTIGLERVDARGARSTWPRRVMPWQRQLPGGEIDLSAWGGLENREAEGR